MKTKLILIRHGQSLGNLKRIYLGHTNLDLSDVGKKQAEIAAEHFRDYDIGAIYTSDLLRAYNTALPHSLIHNLPIHPSVNLREVNLGDWEGVAIDEIRSRWKYEFDHLWTNVFGSMTPPGGEPVYAAAERAYKELFKIASENSGNVIVTAHAALIRAFWCYINGVEPDLWAGFVSFPTNASATFVNFDGEKFIPEKYSFDDYLGNEKVPLNVK